MTRRKKTAYHHGSLRNALIEEAVKILGQSGNADFTLRDLAQRLGVSHSASYRHFANKESLLAAIAETGFLQLVEDQRTGEMPVDPVARIKQLGLVYIRFAVAKPGYFRVMFGTPLADKATYPLLAKASKASFEPVIAAAAVAQKTGQFREGDPEPLAFILWSAVHGLAMLAIDGQVEMSVEKSAGQVNVLAEVVTDAIIKGVSR